MGQKIHPIGFRLGISRGWDSTWFGSKFSYSVFVKDDYKIRKEIMKLSQDAGITKIEIERSTNEISVKIFTSRPGIVIGRGGQRIDELKQLISTEVLNCFVHCFVPLELYFTRKMSVPYPVAGVPLMYPSNPP